MDNVCNRRLFSFAAKVEMAEEQEYLNMNYFIYISHDFTAREEMNSIN